MHVIFSSQMRVNGDALGIPIGWRLECFKVTSYLLPKNTYLLQYWNIKIVEGNFILYLINS